MASVAEYEYEPKSSHLSDAEALDPYSAARRDHPDALVVLDDFDCGHWRVQVHTTDAQKEAYLRRYIADAMAMLVQFLRKR